MPKTTPLYPYHSAHAKLMEFAGYEMPLWYTTTTDEHLAVRNSAGVFDVSHMGRFLVVGEGATRFLEGLVPTAVGTQSTGKAFYTLLLNPEGGIIDDLIIEKLSEDRYVVVVNAANAAGDMEHLRAHSVARSEVEDITPDTAMMAVQGPKAASILQRLTSLDLAQLKRFRCAMTKVADAEALVSRTGYTGEDGFELVVFGASVERPEPANMVWGALTQSMVPCGLAARDSLRLEAGFPLHGSDIDQATDPYQADLAWVVAAGKTGYVGAEALAKRATEPPTVIRRGVVLDSGIPRHGFEVDDASGVIGAVTSGTFSPVLRKGIALCRVMAARSPLGQKVTVAVRGAPEEGEVVKPPFYDETVYGWRRRQP